MIELKKATKLYNDAGSLIFAVNEIDLSIKKGDLISIAGPSGSGKTTLLSLIGCLTKPSSGHIMIDGSDVASLDDEALSALRSEKIGFVFQQAHVIPTMTVLENVLLPLVFSREKDIEKKKERAVKLLRDVGLDSRINSLPKNMSGGQVKRISIARALINCPEILLADEPTGDLDQASSREIMEILKRMNRDENLTVLLVTHNQELAQEAHIKLKMRDGKLV
ncbi:MAG: ABC transporter ATP-binding protein [Candidatus Saganbacteria bacterium]|nr:ABC transporter ATP-binding protein [Candidatus Saganbacteria bacterium]